MPLNHYVTLGHSGLRVSPLCLGTMTFGEEWGFGSDIETSQKVMDLYIDKGGNFIDTANIYTKGHSEKIIGDHIGQHPAKRDRLVIATKFLGNMYPGDPNGGGAHRKHIMDAVDESLRRLQTDYIDLYWMHFWDKHTPIEETMKALEDLVRAGKLRYIGFSDTPAWKCAQAQTIAHFRGWSPLIALQIEYSLIQRTVEGELVPMAEELGLGITPWSPLKGGLLTGKYTRANASPDDATRSSGMGKYLIEKNYLIIDTLEEVAKEHEVSHAQIALAWLLAQPMVQSPIIGARKLHQLEDNLAACDLKLTEDQIKRLSGISTPELNFPYDFLQGPAHMVTHGATTINGRSAEPWPLAPKSDNERF